MRFAVLLLLFIIFTSCHRSVQENNSKPIPITKKAVQNNKIFPDDWLGYWEGELNIYKHSGKTMTIPMALDHAITDIDSIWTWAIIYGEDTITGRRDYELNVVDASKGHYVVDEKNSIFLDAYLLGDCLVSTFKVGGNVVQSNYQLDGDEMLFSIHMHNDQSIRTTGDTIYSGEDIPAVYSYHNTVMQKARLKRTR